MKNSYYIYCIVALVLPLLGACSEPTSSIEPTNSTPSTYVVTYDKNGADSGEVPVDSTSYGAGDNVIVKGNTDSLARSGYNFRGWATTQNAATAEYQTDDAFKITRSLTLYALWRGKAYTISFDKNDGGAGGAQVRLSAEFGTPATLPATTTFTFPPGKFLKGWSKSPTGAVISTYNPESYSAAVTLYAVWENVIVGNKDWSSIAMSSDGTKLAAAVSGGHIYTSSNSGATWTDHSSGAIAGNKDWSSIAMSSDGTKLAAAVSGGHIYTSSNSGATWTDRSSGVIAGNKGWWSIAMSSDGTKLAAAVYARHFYTSSNSGATWTDRSKGVIKGIKFWSSIAMSFDGTKLTAVASDHIYTSSDSGTTWTDRSSSITSSRILTSIAMSSDGTKLAAAAYPGHIYTSSDSGATWTDRSSGVIAGNISWQSIAMSSDGTKLAAAVRGGHIYTSSNSGATWTDRSN